MALPQRWPLDAGGLQDLTGCRIGRFVIKKRLGGGGMGEVYYAEDTKLKRPVALKRVAPKLGFDRCYRERLLKEAERASTLSFRNIAGVFDVLEENGEVFLVMEYVEGDTLRSHLGNPISLNEFHHIAEQCAEALAAAHEKGVLHRDIKPENIMLTRAGEVKVLDFGLAKQLPVVDEKAMTASNESRPMGDAGTSGYVAPEGLLGHELDARADIFSLGVTFYEMLTGRHPFRGRTAVETAERVLHERPAPIHQINPEVPREVEEIVERMLTKDVSQRYASATDLTANLRMAHLHSTQHVDGGLLARIRPRTWPARTRLLLATFTLVTLATAAIVIFLRPRPSVDAPGPRQWVLVADFENSTGNQVFNGSLQTALGAYLQQSSQVRVYPEERVGHALTQLGKPASALVDQQLASQVAVRERIPLVVAGGITGMGDRYLVTLHLVDPYQEGTVGTWSAEARGAEEVLPRLNELARQMREKLGESLQEQSPANKPMERITTASLEALHKYSVARKEHMTGNFANAAALYKEALREDPDFALAYARLSAVYRNLGETDLSQKALEEAWRRVERVTEAERYLISAQYFILREQYEAALENLLPLVKLYPDDASGQQYLVICYLQSLELDAAEKASRRALEIDPSPMARNNLAVVLVMQNRFDEASAVLEQTKARNPELVGIRRLLALAYAGGGKEKKAEQEIREMMAGTAQAKTVGREDAILLMLYQKRWLEAAPDLRQALKERGPDQHPFDQGISLAHLYLAQEKAEAAASVLRQMEKIPVLTLQQRAILASYWALAREPSAVARQERAIEQQAVAESSRHRAYLDLARGARQMAARRAPNALGSLRSAVKDWDSVLAHAVLAQALLESGRWREAGEEYAIVQSRQGESLRSGYPLVAYRLADYYRGVAHESLSEPDLARESYEKFLRFPEKTPPDMPLVRDVRRRLRGLAKPRS